jgi:hypothetical protein
MEPIAPPPCDDRLLLQAWISVYTYPTLIVADRLGVFAALEAKPRSVEELCGELDLGSKSAEAILAVLRSTGFLGLTGKLFELTEVSRTYLLPSSPYYWGGMLHSSGWVSLAKQLMEAVERERQQKSDAGHALLTQWKGGEIKPEVARSFTGAMHSYSMRPAMEMAQSGAFRDVRRVLELGGGSGVCSIAIAMHNPAVTCTVVDLPVVATLANDYIARYGVADRVRTSPADMFHDPWPEGHDAVFFSQIFHDWGPEKNRALAKKSFEALPPGGQVFVLEVLLDEDKAGPAVAAGISIAMLLRMEGKQLSFGEVAALLEEAGFVEPRVAGTFGLHSLVAATKPR